jgi:hypothetical protein
MNPAPHDPRTQTSGRTGLSRATGAESGTGFCTSVHDLTEVRVADPGRIDRLLAARSRRRVADTDGSLMLVAADHPARGALSVGSRPLAMADRADMLERLRAALAQPGVDGVLGTADVLEDLLLLGALEDKIVFASMNRGGLAGSRFEVDDRFTSYDADAIARSGFDGGKMLTRIDLDDPSTANTLESSARAVDDLAAHDLVAMIEPFMSTRIPADASGAARTAGNRALGQDATVPPAPLRNDLSPEAVIRSIHIAQGLGGTSAHTWLKLPAVDDMERVMAATTLPTLILGGDPVGHDRSAVYASWERALAQPAVRGLVVGRTLLYPPDDDVAEAVSTAAAMIHS